MIVWLSWGVSKEGRIASCVSLRLRACYHSQRVAGATTRAEGLRLCNLAGANFSYVMCESPGPLSWEGSITTPSGAIRCLFFFSPKQLEIPDLTPQCPWAATFRHSAHGCRRPSPPAPHATSPFFSVWLQTDPGTFCSVLLSFCLARKEDPARCAQRAMSKSLTDGIFPRTLFLFFLFFIRVFMCGRISGVMVSRACRTRPLRQFGGRKRFD